MAEHESAPAELLQKYEKKGHLRIEARHMSMTQLATLTHCGPNHPPAH